MLPMLERLEMRSNASVERCEEELPTIRMSDATRRSVIEASEASEATVIIRIPPPVPSKRPVLVLDSADLEEVEEPPEQGTMVLDSADLEEIRGTAPPPLPSSRTTPSSRPRFGRAIATACVLVTGSVVAVAIALAVR